MATGVGDLSPSIPGCYQVDVKSPHAAVVRDFIEAATNAHRHGIFLAIFNQGSLQSYYDPGKAQMTGSFMQTCPLLSTVQRALEDVGATCTDDDIWTWFSNSEGKHHKDRPHEGEEDRPGDSSFFHEDCVRVTVHYNSVTSFEGRVDGGELLNVGVVSSQWGRGTTHWAVALDPERLAISVVIQACVSHIDPSEHEKVVAMAICNAFTEAAIETEQLQGEEDFLSFTLPSVLEATDARWASEEMQVCWLKTEPEVEPAVKEKDCCDAAYIVFQPKCEIEEVLAWRVVDLEWTKLTAFRSMKFAEKLPHVLGHTLAYHSHDKIAMPDEDVLSSWQKFTC